MQRRDISLEQVVVACRQSSMMPLAWQRSASALAARFLHVHHRRVLAVSFPLCWRACSTFVFSHEMLRRLAISKCLTGASKRPISTSSILRAQALRKAEPQAKPVAIVKRNPLGVQLLSSTLHSQVFRGASAPPAPPAYLNIALDHLAAHGLDPSKSSQLPSTAFTLPELQGNDLLEHFWRIGLEESQPYLDFAERFSKVDLPPMPEDWELQAGWTKYVWRPDGSGYSESVAYPGASCVVI